MPRSCIDISWLGRQGRDKQFLSAVHAHLKQGSLDRMCGHRGSKDCSDCRKFAEKLAAVLRINLETLRSLDRQQLCKQIKRAIGRKCHGRIVGCQGRLGQPALYLVKQGKQRSWQESVDQSMISQYESTVPRDEYVHYSEMPEGKRKRALERKQQFKIGRAHV